MSRVFVGIPTLNRPALLRATLASVMAQSFQDFTVVVSDNASQPAAAAAVARDIAALGDPRVSLHRQPENRGEYGQGRTLFRRAAEHPLFMILHDDDLLDPTYLETAVAALGRAPGAAYFAANPRIIDEAGRRDPVRTREYLAAHGRAGRAGGEIDVLEALLLHDFTPISATVFRHAALVESGFVDDGCIGLYPFEPNVFLRLGDRGAKAWFCADELFAIRFHPASLRSRLDTMGNIQILDTWVHLLERRRYAGRLEHRRRRFLGRLHRARALHFLRSGDTAAGRAAMRRALRQGVSPATGLLAPFVLAVPGMMRRLLGAPARQYSDAELAGFRRGDA